MLHNVPLNSTELNTANTGTEGDLEIAYMCLCTVNFTLLSFTQCLLCFRKHVFCDRII